MGVRLFLEFDYRLGLLEAGPASGLLALELGDLASQYYATVPSTVATANCHIGQFLCKRLIME